MLSTTRTAKSKVTLPENGRIIYSCSDQCFLQKLLFSSLVKGTFIKHRSSNIGSYIAAAFQLPHKEIATPKRQYEMLLCTSVLFNCAQRRREWLLQLLLMVKCFMQYRYFVFCCLNPLIKQSSKFFS